LGGNYGGGSVNAVYGDFMNPNEVGSGGGGESYDGNYYGGSGGGLVRITAGTLTVNGSILADGGGSWYRGGGSGGGVWLNVGTLSGEGTISAKGGNGMVGGGTGGAGGGGRIAIYYTDDTDFTGSVIVEGGLSGTGTVSSRNGQSGTHQYILK
jgi:hypothetical protein